MAEEFVLAIDQGTTSTRSVLIDQTGRVRGMAQRELTQDFPSPGWVNHDANEIWNDALATARSVLERSGVSIGQIAAIGLTNQRETTVVWDAQTGEPLAPAMVWQSRQSAPLVDGIRERGMTARYQAITGLVPDAYFSATKLAMMLDMVPELRPRAESGDALFGTVDSWLMWRLSGQTRHITDASNASRTMLYDIRQHCWSAELLMDLHVPEAMMPTVVSSSGSLFHSAPDVLGASIPVFGVAGDQQAALFGQACFRPGEAKNTYGTGSFLLMQTGDLAATSNNRLLSTVAWQRGGLTRYALEGAIFVTGAAVQWLRDGLGIIEQASEVEALAASVADSGGVVVVPAFVGLGAPHWDPHARAAILGMSRGTTSAHIARATLEAIALQVVDVVTAMEADSGIALEELRVDGGAAANNLLLQIQADLLGVPVVRSETLETTALGAAFLAGLGTGFWTSEDDIRAIWRAGQRFEPRMGEQQRKTLLARWQAAVPRASRLS